MPQINLKQFLERGERGQSLVEMTVGFIILLTLLAGLLDLGRLYFTFIALEDGAGEAALYAAIDPKCICRDGTPGNFGQAGALQCNPAASPSTECADPDNADFRARDSGSKLVDWTNPLVEFYCTGDCTTGPLTVGDTIDVDITYEFELLTPLINNIAGGTDGKLPITAHASQNVIGDPN